MPAGLLVVTDLGHVRAERGDARARDSEVRSRLSRRFLGVADLGLLRRDRAAVTRRFIFVTVQPAAARHR
jgi:hypothetical protein